MVTHRQPWVSVNWQWSTPSAEPPGSQINAVRDAACKSVSPRSGRLINMSKSNLTSQQSKGRRKENTYWFYLLFYFFQCLRFFHSVNERDMGARIELDCAFVQHPWPYPDSGEGNVEAQGRVRWLALVPDQPWDTHKMLAPPSLSLTPLPHFKMST